MTTKTTASLIDILVAREAAEADRSASRESLGAEVAALRSMAAQLGPGSPAARAQRRLDALGPRARAMGVWTSIPCPDCAGAGHPAGEHCYRCEGQG